MDENTNIPDVNWEKFLMLPDYRHHELLSCLDPLDVNYNEAIKIEMAMLAAMEKGLESYGFTAHACYQIWVRLYRDFMDACVEGLIQHVSECAIASHDLEANKRDIKWSGVTP